MAGTQLFGYVLVAGSGVLLALHWSEWRELSRTAPVDLARREFRRRQLRRRSMASALIGVVGAAMTLIDRVPKTPTAMTCYLFGLLAGGLAILAIAITDWRALVRRRDYEQLNVVADELRKMGDPRSK